MKKKNATPLFWGTLIIILLWGTTVNAASLNLKELENLALKNSPELKKAQIELEEKEIDYTRAKHQASQIPKKTVQEKEQALEEAVNNLQLTKKQIIAKSYNQAISFLDAKATLLERELNLKKETQTLTLSEFRFDKGLISQNELNSQKNKLKLATENKAQAKYNYQLEIMKLNHLVGVSLEEETDLDLPLFSIPVLPQKDDIYQCLIKKDTSLNLLQKQIAEHSLTLELAQMQNEAALVIKEKELALEKLKLDLSSRENELIFLAQTEYLSLWDQYRRTQNSQQEIYDAQERLNEALSQLSLGLISESEFKDVQTSLELCNLKHQKDVLSLSVTLMNLDLPVELVEVGVENNE